MERRFRRARFMVLVLLTAVSSAVLVAGAAAATSDKRVDGGLVHKIEVDSRFTTLTLTFDKGISRASADRVRSSLRSDDVGVAEDEWKLACSDSVTFIDGNGTFDVAYRCGTPRTMPWGYKLSKRVRSIVVGNIHEDGLRWWRNGRSQPKNSPHVVPAYYKLHGTMKPVYRKNDVDSQDYIWFRHNIGPGGRGSVTFAAHLQLTN